MNGTITGGMVTGVSTIGGMWVDVKGLSGPWDWGTCETSWDGGSCVKRLGRMKSDM